MPNEAILKCLNAPYSSMSYNLGKFVNILQVIVLLMFACYHEGEQLKNRILKCEERLSFVKMLLI